MDIINFPRQGILPQWGFYGPTAKLRRAIASLFSQGQQGVMYVPQPTVLGQQLLYQDSAGTTLADANGDPVGRVDDLSPNDNNVTQATSADRPLYQTDGTLHWLAGDGVSDQMSLQWFQQADQDQLLVFAFEQVAARPFGYVFGASNDEGTALLVNNGVLRAFVKNTSGGLALNGPIIANGSPLVASVEWARATGDLRLYMNGNLVAQTTHAAADLVTDNVHALLNRGLSGTQHYNVKVFGGVCVSGDLSGRAEAENYLASLAGITL